MLSIDLKIQRVAEAALAGHRGAVVALDPNNGDVLALVSLPGFDPTLFGRGITAQRVRRAAATTSTSRCSTARCAAPIRPARPSSR